MVEQIFNTSSYYSKNKYDFTEKIKTKFSFIPLVCYESIFSIFTSKKAFNSNFIILATSEEFMNNSYFGRKQYLNIVKLRAIENGRYILKCSNQGISCVINEKGRIVKTITKEIENSKIQRINKNTFYQKILSNL
jgi:apolipoprotein N-acyltransferase